MEYCNIYQLFERASGTSSGHQSANSIQDYIFEFDAADVELFSEFRRQGKLNQIRTLVFRQPDEHPNNIDATPIFSSLIEAKNDLHDLENLYLGASSREVELKLILEAFPGLKILGLENSPGPFDVRHICLEYLLIEYSCSFDEEDNRFAGFNTCVFPVLSNVVMSVPTNFRKSYDGFADSLQGCLSEVEMFTLRAEDCDDLVDILCDSPVFERLQELDLSWGLLTTDGISRIIERLNLPNNLKRFRALDHFGDSSLLPALESKGVMVEAQEADEFDDERSNALLGRIDRRVREQIEGEFRIVLECLPHLNVSVLDEVAVKGMVRFEEEPWWDAEKYVSDIICDPTWMDVAVEGNKLLLALDMVDHRFLERIWVSKHDPDVPDIQIVGMSFGS